MAPIYETPTNFPWFLLHFECWLLFLSFFSDNAPPWWQTVELWIKQKRGTSKKNIYCKERIPNFSHLSWQSWFMRFSKSKHPKIFWDWRRETATWRMMKMTVLRFCWRSKEELAALIQAGSLMWVWGNIYVINIIAYFLGIVFVYPLFQGSRPKICFFLVLNRWPPHTF